MTAGGRAWFAVQLVLFVAMLAAPVIQRFDLAWPVRAAGALILLGGVALAVAAYTALGRSHSPGTTPIAGAAMVQSGVYGHLRHPIYAGWCVGSLGFALIFGSTLGLAVSVTLVVFYDLRAREEEKHLTQQYPEYRAYMARVRRFLPHLTP